MPNSLSLNNLNQITVSGWAYIKNFVSYPCIVFGEQADGYSFLLYQDDTEHYTFMITTDEGVKSSGDSLVVDTDEWHYVVGVYDGSKVKIYVDGEFQNKDSLSGTLKTTIGIEVGHDETYSSSRYWDGLIDNVRIYNYALTGDQIKTLYNNGAISFN